MRCVVIPVYRPLDYLCDAVCNESGFDGLDVFRRLQRHNILR